MNQNGAKICFDAPKLAKETLKVTKNDKRLTSKENDFESYNKQISPSKIENQNTFYCSKMDNSD